MTSKTLKGLLAAVRHEDQRLAEERASYEADASYAGQRPRRSEIASVYGRDTSDARDSAERAYDRAARELKAEIKRQRTKRRPIRAWLWRRAIGRKAFRFAMLAPPLADAWQARRVAVQTRKSAREASFYMSCRIGAGDLAQKIEQEWSAADYAHSQASVAKKVAISKLAAIKIRRDGLKIVSDWLDREQKRFEPHQELTALTTDRVDDWIADTKIGSKAAPPTVRVATASADAEVFRKVSQTVATAWLDQAGGLTRTVNGQPEMILNALAKVGEEVDPALSAALALRRLWAALQDPRHFDPDVKPLLYWVAAAAEVALVGEGTAKTHEEPSTTLLVSKLREASRKVGQPLFRSLGYGAEYPFHLATFEADKPTEAEVGADFGIILQIGLDDREVCRAALVQTKLAKNGSANIYRKSQNRGNMHQLVALTRTAGSGYYLFLDEHPETGPPAAVVSADLIAARLLAQHDVDAVTGLTQSQCKVSTFADAVDFGTFLGFTLIENGLACSSIAEAVGAVGGTAANRIAAKLLVVQIGKPPLDREVTKMLERLGYREARTRWSLDEMVLHASREGSRGRGR